MLDGAADICDHLPGTVKVFLSNVDFGINTSRGIWSFAVFFSIRTFFFVYAPELINMYIYIYIHTKHNSGTC